MSEWKVPPLVEVKDVEKNPPKSSRNVLALSFDGDDARWGIACFIGEPECDWEFGEDEDPFIPTHYIDFLEIEYSVDLSEAYPAAYSRWKESHDKGESLQSFAVRRGFNPDIHWEDMLQKLEQSLQADADRMMDREKYS